MLIIVIEIGICVVLGIGIIIALIVYSRSDQEESNKDEQNKIEFLPSSVNEEILIQNVLISYYERQRHELIERENRVALDDSTIGTTVSKNNDSGYTSVPSVVHTPHSLYEFTGFASMDNLEVINPLFSTELLRDNEQVSVTSPTAGK